MGIKSVKLATKPEKETPLVGNDLFVVLDSEDTHQVLMDGLPQELPKIKLKKASGIQLGGGILLEAAGNITGQTPEAPFTFELRAGGTDRIPVPEDTIVLFRLDVVVYIHRYRADDGGSEDCDRAGYAWGYIVSGMCWRDANNDVYIPTTNTHSGGPVIQETFGYGASSIRVSPEFPEGDTEDTYLPMLMTGICDLEGNVNYKARATLHLTTLEKPENVPDDHFGICDADGDESGDGICSCRDA